MISGEVILRLFSKGEQLYSQTLRKGDFLYIPKGVEYQTKSKLQKNGPIQGYTVVLMLSTGKDHTWKTLINKSLE